MVSFASRRRRAITLRTLSCGTASYEPGSNNARIFSSVGVCTAGASAPAAAAAAGAAIPRPRLAASPSPAVARPGGRGPLTPAAAVRAGTLDACEIDAGLLRQPTRQGRREDAVRVRDPNLLTCPFFPLVGNGSRRGLRRGTRRGRLGRFGRGPHGCRGTC